MLFHSLIFLFLFLPVVLGMYLILRKAGPKNLFLLIVSIFFYSWGELNYLWLMVLMILVNYTLALVVDSARTKGNLKIQRSTLALAIVANIGLLIWFKYADFLVVNLNWMLENLVHSKTLLSVPHIKLPLGISFLAFHCTSYVVDVYRGVASAQRNLLSLSLYISLFPQLIAGPIIRYHEICHQLDNRTNSVETFALGVRRFVVGLGKKMLVANAVAGTADAIFALPSWQLSPALAWLGAVSYTLQIYFDFSGYSDMAIGLGLMFGFQFPENFNFPYAAQSIQQFWRRWHMSLSNWFRDYLYIPLGGNKLGAFRTCLNLLTIFFLCGLWHGASWTFIVWGLYHGAFLGLERLGLARTIEYLPRPIRHIYTMLVVVIGWVIFRSDTLPQATAFIRAMFGFACTVAGREVATEQFLDTRLLLFLVVGVLAAIPWKPVSLPAPGKPLWPAVRVASFAVLLFLSIAEMSSGSYNPFIYFRF